MGLYRDAGARFVVVVDDYLNGVDIVPCPPLGPEATQAFQEAVDGARAVLDVMSREARRLVCESWAP